MAISHFKTDPQADFTGTVTIYNSDGITGTVNATDMVRPSDWNSAHQMIFNLSGNTAGSSQITGADVILMGGANITLSADTAASKLEIIGGAGAGGGIAAAAGTQTATSGTIVFANSNGITAGMSGSSQITFSHNGITSQSVQTQNMVSVLGSTGNISFANGNGITFGANASTITASHNGITSQSVQTQNVVAPSAGTQTATSGTVVFSNNAAITFGMSNNSVITATHNGLTTAMQSQSSSVFARTGFTSTTQAGTAISATLNTNGLSMAVPQFLTTAALSGDTTKYAGVSSGTQTTAGTNIVMTHNTAGLNLGVPAYITTAARSQDSSNYAGLGTTFNGANISGSMTMNTNGLQLSLSAGAGGGGGTAATIYATSNTTQSSSGTMALSSMIFAGAGIASVGVTNGSVVVSVPAGGGAGDGYNIVSMLTATSGGGTAGATYSNSAASIGFMAGSNITLSQTSNTIVVNAPGSSSLVGGSNITISTGGSTISVIGVGSLTMSNWRNMPLGNNTTFSTLGQNSVYLQHFIPDAVLQFSNVEILGRGTFVSSSNSKVYAQTLDYGLYSQDTGANSTRMTLMSSSQIKYTTRYNSNTAVGFTISQGAGSFTTSSGATNVITNISGAFHNYLPMTATLQPNNKYALALRMSSATTVATGPWAWAPLAMSVQTSNHARIYVSTTTAANASNIGDREMGVYATTTTALPNSYATSDMRIAVSRQNLYIQFE